MKSLFLLIVIGGALVLVGCGQDQTPEDKAFFSQMSSKNPPRSKGGPKKDSATDTEKASKVKGVSALATEAPPATGK